MESMIKKHTRKKSKHHLVVMVCLVFLFTDFFLGTCVCVPVSGSHFLHSSVCPAQPLLFAHHPWDVSIYRCICSAHTSKYHRYKFIFSRFFHKMYIWHLVFPLAFFLNSRSWHSLPIKDIQMCCVLSSSCIIFHYRRVPPLRSFGTRITFFLHIMCHLM